MRILTYLLLIILTVGCGTTRIKAVATDNEKLIIKPSAPSILEYTLNGRVMFRRTGSKPLPTTCRVLQRAAPDVEIEEVQP